jgi:uncharacterized peroxidase-related enzyme
MPRISPVIPADATGHTARLLETVEKSLGSIPNILATMVHSPAVCESYLALNGTLKSGRLDDKLRECIALTVSGSNRCTYCASAHTALGKQAGMSDDEARQCLNGEGPDERINAAVVFARAIVEKRGWIADADLDAIHQAGFDDEQIIEILGNVVLTIFTNYFNHLAQTDVDFPVVELPANT